MPKIKGWKVEYNDTDMPMVQYRYYDGTIARVEYVIGKKPFPWRVYCSSGVHQGSYEEGYKTKEKAIKELHSWMKDYSKHH